MTEGMMDVEQIMRTIPHRYPFLLVDRIVAFDPDRSITGIKNVSINEPFFAGHIPGHPVMPGVLIIEAMAQVGACLLLRDPDRHGRPAYLTSIESARFRRRVTPGDQLVIKVDVLRWRARFCKLRGEARVGDQVAAESVLTVAFLENADDVEHVVAAAAAGVSERAGSD